jgi:hypothetical protein
MINYERVAEKIFSIIKGHGHTLSMYKEDGMDTTDAAEARRFFVSKPNYMITLDEDTNTIKINKNSDLELEDLEGIMKQMKNLARENMLNTQVKVFGKEITPKDFAYQAKKFKDANMESITNEASLSRMSGSKKTSYQTLESVKMIVRHRKAVDEDVRGSRSRQIKAIFLEQGGERLRFPHNHLAGARAMARHMYEGGNMQDTIGEYIVESVSNMIKLNEFVRYARSNKLMNEANEDVVKTVKENIATIRGELKGLTGAKSYAKISEAIAAREASVLEEDDTADLQDMFTVRKFDEKITTTLPLVRRLMNEKQAWRDALVEASQQTIYMSAKEPLAEEDIMEFDSPSQQVGYKINKLAKRMVESGDLSNFVSKVAGKLIEGSKISEFEKTIVRNVMENAKIEEVIEDDYCDKCGEDMWGDCKCKKQDAVESVTDSFELKMKMIEHEEIFTEEEGQCSECDGVGEVWGKACEKCGGEEELEEADRTLANPYTPPPKRECSDCGDFASYLTDRHENDLHYTCDTCGHEEDDQMVDLNFAGEIDEAEGDTCIRCRKGTMEVGDTMMGAQEKCNRCGYQHAVREDDHHAGEIAAGAHSGMPSTDDSPDQDHLRIVDLVMDDLQWDESGMGADEILELVMEYFPEDKYNSPAIDKVYTTVMNRLGANELTEMRRRAGIVESDAEKAGSGNVDPEDFMDDCPDCGGNGKAKDSIFDDDECTKCGGEGYV